jgi:GTPase-associated protein 1, N-terminal domain type 2
MTTKRMENSVIEQALYGSDGGRGYRFLARSPGFRHEWSAEAERLCTGFGERPAEVSCPECLFVQPFAGKYVAVVRAADRGVDSEGRPGTLQFHLLVLPRSLYDDVQGDPFHIAAVLPPPWDARVELPTINWNGAAPAPRTVAALQTVLDVPNSATLLGGAQALLDGAALVFERSGPDAQIVQSLWALLPAADRARLWPATYRFGNAEAFDVVVVPPKRGPESARFVTEEKCGDYPEGRYELALQVAVESGNQAGLDALLTRRSRRQTVALSLALLFIVLSVLLVPLALNLLSPETPPGTLPSFNLPGPEEFPQLKEDERIELATRLQQLGKRLGTPLPAGSSLAELTATLAALDNKLGTPDPARNSGPIVDWGPVQRQLRVLLWKHDVPDYNRLGMRTPELVDRLEKKIIPAEKAP